MRRATFTLRGAMVAAIVAAVLPASALAASATAPRSDGRLPDRYIVVYRSSVNDVRGKTNQLQASAGFRATHRYGAALKGFAATLSGRQLQFLQDHPDVAFISPDRRVEALGEMTLASGDSAPTGVRRIEAATTTTAREPSGLNVAVIDSGIDLSHSDLTAVHGKNCIGSGNALDDNGHGTHVAGTIAAKNNGVGVVGVAPGTKVHAVKVLDAGGSGSWTQVICGIDWVTSTRTDADPDNDIAVANLSLGGPGPAVQSCSTTTDALHRAICNSTSAGVTYVVAAGNSGRSFDGSQAYSPAAYPQVLTVTAVSDSDGLPGGTGGAPSCRTTEPDDRYASFSNYATTTAGRAHTIAAPGVCIRSTWKGGAYNDTISGTSMATPHIAGTVALCMAEGTGAGPCAGLSPAQIIQHIRSTAASRTSSNPEYGFNGDPTRPVSGRYYGYLGWLPTFEGASEPVPDVSAPSIASVLPADGATAVGSTSTVSVTFSEPMDTAATQAAFSLVDLAGDGVPGSFSWSTNTMTFRPSTALANETNYVGTVTTDAKDVAGNPLGVDKSWGFTTVSASTLFPSSTTIASGSLRSGSYTGLGADDDAYFQVTSTSSSTYKTSWRGTFKGISNSLRSLSVAYKGKNSRTCAQSVFLYNFTKGSWVKLDSRSVGTTEGLVEKSPGGPLADYVSGSSGDGDVRVRVRCTLSSALFYTSADLMSVSVTK